MNEIVRIETEKINSVLSRPINDLEGLLKAMNGIKYQFYDTEHKVGDFMIKIFKNNGAFTGGAILFNEATKEFIFITDIKVKQKAEYVIISNNAQSEKDFTKLLKEFTKVIPVAEDSFLNSNAFKSVLTHRIRPFEKEKKLSIASKGFKLLLLYAFSKIGSSTHEQLPASFVAYIRTKHLKNFRYLSEATKNNLEYKNVLLSEDHANYHIYNLINLSITSKKFRHLYKSYGTKELLLIKETYIAFVNEVFNV